MKQNSFYNFSILAAERLSETSVQRIASHIIKVHASGAATSSTNTEAIEGENWAKKV
jgi:hypothetical protein